MPNKIAQKNHDEMFPNHVSTLKQTDPEFIDIFDNFAFDEVLQHSHEAKATDEGNPGVTDCHAVSKRVQGHVDGSIERGCDSG